MYVRIPPTPKRSSFIRFLTSETFFDVLILVCTPRHELLRVPSPPCMQLRLTHRRILHPICSACTGWGQPAHAPSNVCYTTPMPDTPSHSAPQLDTHEVRHTLTIYDVERELERAGVGRS